MLGKEGGVLDPKAMKVGDLTKSAAMQSALNFASMPSQNGKGKGKPKTKKEKNEAPAEEALVYVPSSSFQIESPHNPDSEGESCSAA